MTFQEYIENKFWEENPQTLDDDAPDAQADWEAGLDPQDLMDWAEKWHQEELIKLKEMT